MMSGLLKCVCRCSEQKAIIFFHKASSISTMLKIATHINRVSRCGQCVAYNTPPTTPVALLKLAKMRADLCSTRASAIHSYMRTFPISVMRTSIPSMVFGYVHIENDSKREKERMYRGRSPTFPGRQAFSINQTRRTSAHAGSTHTHRDRDPAVVSRTPRPTAIHSGTSTLSNPESG